MSKDNRHATIHFWLAVSVILTFPFSIKVSSALIGVWVAHWLFVVATGHGIRPDWRRLIIMISLFVIYLISLSYSSNLAYGIFSVEKRLSLLLIPVVVSSVPYWTTDRMEKFFGMVTIGVLTACLYCLSIAIYRWTTNGENAFYWMSLTSPLQFHPSYFSFLIMIVMIWVGKFIISHWNGQSGMIRISVVAVMLFFMVFLILLASRVQLFLFYLTLLLLVLYNIRRLPRVWLALVVVIIGLSTYSLTHMYIWERIMNITSIEYRLNDPPSKFNELTNRLALAECSWEVIRNHWIIGVGAGDSYDELDKVYRQVDYQFGYLDHQEPHNEYLNVWISTGLPGLVSLLTMFGLTTYLAVVRKNLHMFLFISFFSFSCLFESMLSQQKGVVLFAILNSLFVFVDEARPASPSA